MDAPDPVKTSSTGMLIYTASINNISNVDAEAVTFTQTLPGYDGSNPGTTARSYVDILSVTPSQGYCNTSITVPYSVTCEIGNIVAHDVVSINIETSPLNTTLLKSEGIVTAKGKDADTSNNFVATNTWSTLNTITNTDIGISVSPVSPTSKKKGFTEIEWTITNYGPEILYQFAFYGETSSNAWGGSLGFSGACSSVRGAEYYCYSGWNSGLELLPGESVTGIFKIENLRTGESTTTFNLTGSAIDNNQSNNSASATVLIVN